jgi:hypothetical protein
MAPPESQESSVLRDHFYDVSSRLLLEVVCTQTLVYFADQHHHD